MKIVCHFNYLIYRNVNGTQSLKNSYLESKKGAWHRSAYLPWLLAENEFACFLIAFNVKH